MLIVDDHSVLRVGLKEVLEDTGEFEVVGQAWDGDEAVRVAAEVLPDVVVMDVLMPGKDGVQACREIMESAPSTRVIMLTASSEEDAVVDSLAAGATGYLQKEADLDRLLSAVHDVAKGELRVPAGVVSRVFAGIREDTGSADPDPVACAGLSERQRELLVLFARGMSYGDIAREQGVQAASVRNAIYRIQHKLKVNSMQGLVVWAVRNGLVE